MNATQDCPTAAAIIIGNEILSGRTQDVNIGVIARMLFSLGIRFMEVRVVRDDEKAIAEAINALRRQYSYVLTTGGIGPTHDDITAASVAKAFGVPLERHPEAYALLKAYYTAAHLNAERAAMADMPKGARLIDNPVSVIPGFQIENVYVLAGVPEVVKAMLDSVALHLKNGPCFHVATINCSVSEGVLAGALAAIAAGFPDLDIGSYPSFRMGKIGVALVVRGNDKDRVENAASQVCAMIVDLGGKPEVERG